MWIAVAHTAPSLNAAAAFRNDFDEAIVDTNLSLPQQRVFLRYVTAVRT